LLIYKSDVEEEEDELEEKISLSDGVKTDGDGGRDIGFTCKSLKNYSEVLDTI